MKQAQVDLYICGHDHHLELIDGQPRFLISGAGSDPVPPLLPHAKTLFPSETSRQLGFAVVELDAGSMTIRFFDGEGKAISKPFTFPPLATQAKSRSFGSLCTLQHPR